MSRNITKCGELLPLSGSLDNIDVMILTILLVSLQQNRYNMLFHVLAEE